MEQILGEIINGQYLLTAEGKKELVEEISRRRQYHQEKKYNDSNFSSIINFIFSNLDNTINVALGENVISGQIPLDRHATIARNGKKLETWFESVASSCNREDLTGANILNYFCSDEYQEGISKYGLASTIDEMTQVLKRNITLENEELINNIKGSDSKPIRR